MRLAAGGNGRARRPCVGLAFVVGAALAAAPTPSLAQGALDGRRGAPEVPGADTVPPGQFNFGLSLGYLGAGSDRLRAAPVGVTFGLSNHLDATLAFLAWSPADFLARGVAQDARLGLKYRLVYERKHVPAIALSAIADHLLQGVDVAPALTVQKNFGPLQLILGAGVRLPRHATPVDPAGPSYGAALSWFPTRSTTLALQATMEGKRGEATLSVMPAFAYALLGPDPLAEARRRLVARGKEIRQAIEAEEAEALGGSPAATALPVPDPAAAPAEVLANAAFGGRPAALANPGRLSFFVSGGPFGGAHRGFRVVVGLQASSFDEMLWDSDGDGIPDRFDRCPFEPEDYDGFEDEDGCPDHGVEVVRKQIRERAARKAAKEPAYRDDRPRFRMAIPPGSVPSPTDPDRRDDAPSMYAPLAPAEEGAP